MNNFKKKQWFPRAAGNLAGYSVDMWWARSCAIVGYVMAGWLNRLVEPHGAFRDKIDPVFPRIARRSGACRCAELFTLIANRFWRGWRPPI
jgi:hypothetical protein